MGSHTVPVRLSGLVSLLLAALLLSACAQQAEIPPTGGEVAGSELLISADNANITVPEQVSGGLTRVTLTSTADAPLTINLARLNDDVTLEQFMQAFQEDAIGAVSLVRLLGGIDVVAGEDRTFSVNLDEGTHIAIGFGETEGPPLVTPFQAGAAEGDLVPPESVASVDMQDFAFVMPDRVPAGEQVWEVTNSGSQWHEYVIVRGEEGLTQEQLMEMLMAEEEPEGPPPFEVVDYFGPISEGERAWVQVDLEPGNYFAICFLPDAASGTSHVDLGMIQEFAVGE